MSDNTQITRTPMVLLVEDSEDDRFFFKRALSKAQCPHELVSVVDGHEALEYLGRSTRPEASDKSARPDLIFLDLKLPKFSGFEVLKWLKERDLLPRLRVVVLSGSDQEKDRQLARELGAADYVVKPVQPEYLRASLGNLSKP